MQPSPVALRRLEWLDVLRVLCALEIVGFHWLRACFNNGAFGRGDPVSLIDPYRSPGRGLSEVHYLLLDRSGPLPAALATDALGWLFGFGWVAVNVFILLSGLSLTLQAARTGGVGDLRRWYGQRLQRVLVPFYLVALPVVMAAYGFKATAAGRHGLLGQLGDKVAAQMPGNFVGVIAKHLFLVDVTQQQFVATFFAPAWWFVPTIVVGYLVFPILLAVFRRVSVAIWLCSALIVTVASYGLSQAGVLLENAWYFIPGQELFSFAVGIALGHHLAESGAEVRLRQRLGSASAMLLNAVLFTLGTVLAWFAPTYAFSSPLYTLGATGILGFAAVRISTRPSVVRLCQMIDPYHLYLLHQPLAFPLAAVAAAAMGAWATSAGILLFLPLCWAVAATFGWLLMQLFRLVAYMLQPKLLGSEMK